MQGSSLGSRDFRLSSTFGILCNLFLVAAIVFSGVLALVKKMNLTATLFSFQNGFFWQTVFFQKEAYRRVGPSGGETNTEVSL